VGSAFSYRNGGPTGENPSEEADSAGVTPPRVVGVSTAERMAPVYAQREAAGQQIRRTLSVWRKVGSQAEEAGGDEQTEAHDGPKIHRAPDPGAAAEPAPAFKPPREDPRSIESDSPKVKDAVLKIEAEGGKAEKAPPKQAAAPKAAAEGGEDAEAAASGIATTVAVERFTAAAQQAKKDWTSRSVEDRRQTVESAIQGELAHADVFIPDVKLKKLGYLGVFQSQSWEIELKKETFEKNDISEKEVSELAGTVYHEARHAEQWHKMGRNLASKGKGEAEIASAINIPKFVAADVVSKAAQNPLDAKQSEQSDAIFESVYGARSAHREQVHKRVKETYDAREKAEKAYKQIVGRGNAQQMLDAWLRWERTVEFFDKALAPYWELPEEKDALEAETKVTDKLK
jgi:hypothetical protein